MHATFQRSFRLSANIPAFWLLVAIASGVLAASPAAAQPPLRFAIVGDFGDAPQNALDSGVQQVADLALGNTSLVPGWTAPDLVVTVGDNTYGTSAQWNTYVGAYYGSYIEDPTPGTPDERTAGTGNNKFFPTLGNHDWDAGLTSYQDYFVLPSTPASERYYDFVRGNVHFFMVDSDPREPDGVTSVSTQAAWLQNSLQNSTSQWKLVFFHHPAYNSGGSHGNTLGMRWNFASWGADAVFSGHEHVYERSEANGIPYITSGNAGHDLDFFTSTPNAESRVRYNGDYGATLVEADNTAVSIKHYTRSGQLIDSYNIGGSNPVTMQATFQQGAAGYTSTVDTHLREAAPATNSGAAVSLNVDTQETGGNPNTRVQALLKFDNLFGNGTGQVPLGATIVSATLEFRTTNTSTNPPGGATLHQLLVDWNTSSLNSTWANWGDGLDGANGTGGIQLDGNEALAAIVARVHTPEVGRTIFDITGSIQAWQLDPNSNFGWVLNPTSTDGWDFDSADATGGSTFRPLLTINYIVPEPATAWLLACAGVICLCRFAHCKKIVRGSV